MLESFLRLVKISRPVFWLVAPAAYLFGVAAGGTAISAFVLFQAFLLTLPLGVYVFGVNDLYDIASDRANPRRKGELWGARVGEEDRRWIPAASLLAAGAILASAVYTVNPLHIAVVALFLPFPYLYSAPPFRLKSRPVMDSITNAAYTYGPFAMGYSLSGSAGFLDANMILFALVFSAAHAVGTVMDLEGDRKAGIRTFASVFGPRAAAIFAVAVLALNLPFLWGAMKSMFAVVSVYLLASLYVLARPKPEAAKSAFVAMNISLMAWMAYAFCGFALGFWEVA